MQRVVIVATAVSFLLVVAEQQEEQSGASCAVDPAKESDSMLFSLFDPFGQVVFPQDAYTNASSFVRLLSVVEEATPRQCAVNCVMMIGDICNSFLFKRSRYSKHRCELLSISETSRLASFRVTDLSAEYLAKMCPVATLFVRRRGAHEAQRAMCLDVVSFKGSAALHTTPIGNLEVASRMLANAADFTSVVDALDSTENKSSACEKRDHWFILSAETTSLVFTRNVYLMLRGLGDVSGAFYGGHAVPSDKMKFGGQWYVEGALLFNKPFLRKLAAVAYRCKRKCINATVQRQIGCCASMAGVAPARVPGMMGVPLLPSLFRERQPQFAPYPISFAGEQAGSSLQDVFRGDFANCTSAAKATREVAGMSRAFCRMVSRCGDVNTALTWNVVRANVAPFLGKYAPWDYNGFPHPFVEPC